MSFIIYQILGWYLACTHGVWWMGLVMQPVLIFNLFSETWTEYAGIMRFKMILPQLGPKARALAWISSSSSDSEKSIMETPFWLSASLPSTEKSGRAPGA